MTNPLIDSLAALVSLPLAMGLLTSWRSCQALRRITSRTL